MSRIILFVGILLVIISVLGFVIGMVSFPMQIANTVSSVSNPDGAKYCHSDETLATEEGPEEYNASQQVHDHPVYFYCVNPQGVRREVTDQVGQGVVNGIFSSFGSIGSALVPIAASVLCVPGIIMIVIGAIFSPSRVMRARLVSRGRSDDWTTPPISQQATFVQQQQQMPSPNSDLAGRLRQLEEARQSGLLTEDEYQQKRRQILGNLQ